jgi:hypothetical protein
VSQANELATLQAHGIVEISLTVTRTAVQDDGNWVLAEAEFTLADGSTQTIGDVWLQSDRSGDEDVPLIGVADAAGGDPVVG